MFNLKEMILRMIKDSLMGFDRSISKIEGILSLDIDHYSEMFKIAKNMNAAIYSFALTLATIVLMIELIKITLKFDIVKKEFIYQFCMKILVTKNALDLSFPLLLAIYSQSITMVKTLTTAEGSGVGAAAIIAVEKITTGMNAGQYIGIFLTTSIAWIGLGIVTTIITALAYARFFELLMYVGVSPLPFAFMTMENSRITKKFVFSFSAVCLQSILIMMAIKFFQAMTNDVFLSIIKSSASMGDVAYNMLMAAIVLLIAVVQSGQFAKNILDA